MPKDIRREDRPGLYCVELRTENWDALVEWYREVLGLRVLVRVIDDGYALLEAGETRLALLSRSSAGEAAARVSLAFEVKDVRKICADQGRRLERHLSAARPGGSARGQYARPRRQPDSALQLAARVVILDRRLKRIPASSRSR